jgi:hypothetical protein
MCRHTYRMPSRAWASLLHLAPSRVHQGLPLRPCQEVPALRRWQDIVIPQTYLVGNPSILRYRLMAALSYLFIDSLQPSHPNEHASFRVPAHPPTSGVCVGCVLRGQLNPAINPPHNSPHNYPIPRFDSMRIRCYIKGLLFCVVCMNVVGLVSGCFRRNKKVGS